MKTKGLDQAEPDQGSRQCIPARCVIILATAAENSLTSLFVVHVRVVVG
jgi:hypothetical protein